MSIINVKIKRILFYILLNYLRMKKRNSPDAAEEMWNNVRQNVFPQLAANRWAVAKSTQAQMWGGDSDLINFTRLMLSTRSHMFINF